jgi:hypothetical protein
MSRLNFNVPADAELDAHLRVQPTEALREILVFFETPTLKAQFTTLIHKTNAELIRRALEGGL